MPRHGLTVGDKGGELVLAWPLCRINVLKKARTRGKAARGSRMGMVPGDAVRGGQQLDVGKGATRTMPGKKTLSGRDAGGGARARWRPPFRAQDQPEERTLEGDAGVLARSTRRSVREASAKSPPPT